jgi:nucleotide-binding universal stress UspA family protein
MATSRIRFTAEQKAELWERWRKGQSAAAISRALDRRNKTGVDRIVVLHGGIAPAPRRRAFEAVIEGQGVKDVDLVIEDDDAANKILEITKREKIDFVVMGRRGLGALAGILSGSVPQK